MALLPSSRNGQRTIAYLQKKIQTKDEVLAELMAEQCARRSSLGCRHPRIPVCKRS